MGATVFHVFTNPQADGVDPTIVRPSDWNSSHLLTLSAVEQLSIAGNVAGVAAAISGSVVLAGGNNITLSQNGQSITVSGPATPAQGSDTLGMSNLGNTSGTSGVISGSAVQLILAGGNNITLSQSINGQSATITISAPNQSVQTQGLGSDTLGMSNLGNTSGTTGVVSGPSVQMVLVGGNNVTLSQSINGSSATITISGINTSQGSDTLGMSNVGNTSGTSGVVSGSNVQLVLAGGNNITLSQSINGSSATITISAFTQTVQTQSFSNTLGMSNLGNTSGTSGVISGTGLQLLFAGGNNVTLSQSINGSSATITISAGTAAAGSFSAGMSNLGLTSGSSGTVSGQLVLVGSGGILLSGSTNGGSATVSIMPGTTLDQFLPFSENTPGITSAYNACLLLAPFIAPLPVTFSQFRSFGSFSVSSSSNSSHAGTLSLSVGLYTRSGSTLSLASSGSTNYQWTNTSNNSTSVLQGVKEFTTPISGLMLPGEYVIGVWTRTSSAGNNWFTHQNVLGFFIQSAWSGEFFSASNSSNQGMLGWGFLSGTANSFATAMPASIHVSNIAGASSGSRIFLVPTGVFANTTA